jgi:hypothetical protein
MTCGCGRSPDSCRGWHSLSEEEYKIEYKKEFGNLKKQNNLLTVTEVHHWTDKLFSFRTEKPEVYYGGLEWNQACILLYIST